MSTIKRPNGMILALQILLVLFIAYWGLRRFERSNLYFPSREMTFTPKTFGLAFEDAHLKTQDGVQIHGWYIPHPKARSAALFLHGNGGNISHRLQKAKLLHDMGLAVFLLDYRGYGLSRGTPSEKGTYRDADAAYLFLTQKGFQPSQIAIYGESLGCAIAIDLAARLPCAALIAESPFTSTVEMGELIFPFLPVRWLVRYRYDSLSKAPRIKCPSLFLHSPQDEIVPYEMGRRLFAAAPQPKEFFEMQGGHNDGFAQTPGYAQSLSQFLERFSVIEPK